MATKSAFSILGLAHKFFANAERLGYTPQHLNDLAENETLLSQPLRIQMGYAEVTTLKHDIDLDRSPYVPTDLQDEEHRMGGLFEWDPAHVELYLSPGQQNPIGMKGDRLRVELRGKPVLNANLMFYLFSNPHLIPEEWKTGCSGS